MKFFSYKKSHPLDQFAIKEQELPPLKLEEKRDILVDVKAISFNPIDYKIRQTRSKEEDRGVILGWDASGVVAKVGIEVTHLAVGDKVYYAGDLNRDGSYGDCQLVDSRLVAKKSPRLNFAEAASLPLTMLTAWEALFERGVQYDKKSKILIIGGAGGVGSASIQLLKAMTSATVIATASRAESIDWCQKMGADLVINHHQGLTSELAKNQIKDIDLIFATTHSDHYLKEIPALLRPFGHLCLIDDPKTFEPSAFKKRAISVHFELMFAKSMHDYQQETQRDILASVTDLVEQGKVKTIANSILHGFNVENIRKAHEMLEQGTSIGKIVMVKEE